MKLTIELELDDYTDLLAMLAKNGKKKIRLAAVEPALSNGQRIVAGIADEQPQTNGQRGALLLREVSRLRNNG